MPTFRIAFKANLNALALTSVILMTASWTGSLRKSSTPPKAAKRISGGGLWRPGTSQPRARAKWSQAECALPAAEARSTHDKVADAVHERSRVQDPRRPRSPRRNAAEFEAGGLAPEQLRHCQTENRLHVVHVPSGDGTQMGLFRVSGCLSIRGLEIGGEAK